jgi:circadian clock protein KaiC
MRKESNMKKESRPRQGLILDMSKIKAEVEKKLHVTEIFDDKTLWDGKYISTGITGFDELFERGIPKGANVIVAGSAGSGKTIFCLQTLTHHARRGKKCLYMSFEEPESQLIDHMREFGWNPDEVILSNNLKIKMFLTSDIYYDMQPGGQGVDAMIANDSDSLLMDLKPLAITKTIGFKPDMVVLDSLTAIASSFMGREQSYRFYVERLFRFFKGIGCTTFLITETPDKTDVYSPTGVEEFIADGVIVLYNLRNGNIRESGIEILKMRGSRHQKKIVAMQIDTKGISVYPDLEIFGRVEKNNQ